MDGASNAIAPLQDAVNLGIAEPSELDLLTKWKTFRVMMNRVDVTVDDPTWSPASADELRGGSGGDDELTVS